MRWSRAAPAAAALLVLIAAAITYTQVVPVTHVSQSRLARLVVSKPPAGYAAKATSAGVIPASSSPFKEVSAAAARSPRATGTYSVQWSPPKSTTTVDVILATLLPTEPDAATVLGQAKSIYQATEALSADKYTKAGTFPVPSVPGATSASFTSTTKGNSPVAIVVFRVQKVVIVAFSQEPGAAAKSSAAAATLAAAEYQHLAKVAPGFTFVYTTWSLVTSVVFWAISVAAALGAGVLVALLMWAYRHRRAKEAARLEAIRQAQERDRRRRAARRAGDDRLEAHPAEPHQEEPHQAEPR